MKQTVIAHELAIRDEKTLPQIYSILIVSMNSLLAGALFAWPSPAIPFLLQNEEPYKMTMPELSHLATIPAISTIVCSPFVGSIIDVFGRKRSLIVVMVPYVLAIALCMIGGPIYVYYISRILDGIGDACLFSVLPCYVAEISTPRVRGRWGNAVALTMYLGQGVMNTFGTFFSIEIASGLLLIFPVLLLLNYPILRESPYWLLMKDRTEEARKSLQWLRGKENVEDELSQLMMDVKRQQSETGRYIDLIKIPSNRRSLFIGGTIRLLQNFTGAAAIAVYIQTVFKESGSDLPAGYCSMIYNGSCFVCSLIASSILDKLGRRLATILSCACLAAVLFLQGGVFFINDQTDWDVPGFTILPLVLMVVYIMSFSIGMGIVPTMLLGELFSSSIKSKAFVIMNINMGLSVAIAAQVFALLMQYVGMYAIFWFYAVCTLISVFICYFIMPETKGKTLEEIQQEFKK